VAKLAKIGEDINILNLDFPQVLKVEIQVE